MQQHRFRLFIAVSIILHLLLVALLIPSLRKHTYEQPFPVEVSLTTEPAQSGSRQLRGAISGISKPAGQPAVPPPVATQPSSVAPIVQAQPVPPQPAQTTSQKLQPSIPVAASNTGHQVSAHPAAATLQPRVTVVDPSSGSARPGVAKGGYVDAAFGSLNGPAFKKQIAPVYPSQARRRGREGVVLLKLMINDAGQLSSVEVVDDPGFGFAEAAVEAVRASSFRAAQQDGRPVASRTTLPVRFRFQ